MIVQADFTGNATMEFYEGLFDKVKDKDIAIVVNNAGVMIKGHFQDLEVEEIIQTMDTNVTHVSMMTKLFLDKLITRNKRGAIINVASVVAGLASPAIAIYCASKSFVRHLTESVEYEARDKLDMQCFCPGYTKTNLHHLPD